MLLFCRCVWVRCAIASVFAVSVSPAAVGAQRATPRDIRAAMADTAFGFIHLTSDGSARGDSARRIGALALWDLEGGDPARGRRLLQEAMARGVPDTLFYLDAVAYLKMLPSGAAALARMRSAAARQFPAHHWPWSGGTK